jgi:hypothetical protein
MNLFRMEQRMAFTTGFKKNSNKVSKNRAHLEPVKFDVKPARVEVAGDDGALALLVGAEEGDKGV